jgi:DNA (cytosine-5)-methyltransferase 1
MRFIDLFAGLGGFHVALARLGHECVFASEIDPELQEAYEKNFGFRPTGDIRLVKSRDIPAHDVLCAGFPCQPFSKAGAQQGFECPRWGDAFDQIVRILHDRRPAYFILENVANLRRHDRGRTWRAMIAQLRSEGYSVEYSHRSPSDLGIPQNRDRIFIVGARAGLPSIIWPRRLQNSAPIAALLERSPPDAIPLPRAKVRVLEVWQEFLDRFPNDDDLPSFPIWSAEFGATYPYEDATPWSLDDDYLRGFLGGHGRPLTHAMKVDVGGSLPSYALDQATLFPRWKIRFIRQNRALYARHKHWIDQWLPNVSPLAPSHQKLEWNCKGGARNLWDYLVQFRASGVRVRSPKSAPALVAMNTTQVPVVAWERRYMTPRECATIQGLAGLNHLPSRRETAFRALGNAVNADLVEKIAEALLVDERQLQGTGTEFNALSRASNSTTSQRPTKRGASMAVVSNHDRVNIRPPVNVLSVLRHLNYQPWYALAEFVDNALQSYLDYKTELRKGAKSHSLNVAISIDEADDGRITIRDNAAGIHAKDYARAFRAAEVPPDRSGLSEFGMGMKSAACWFAPHWTVRTTALGETVERTITFDINAIVRDSLEELEVRTRPARPESHYTEIVLSQVHRLPRRRTLGKVKEHLASMYRAFTREGTLELTLNGEPLTYDQPRVLVAPFFKTPTVAPVPWRKDIRVDLGRGMRVTGFAALREKGSTSEAGFALFRRGRVVLGTADQGYRPESIFGSSNSYVYQRLFGELSVEGFGVSHTKDGFQWDDHEEEILAELKAQLDAKPLPLIQQALGYRAKPTREEAVNVAAEVVANTATAFQAALEGTLEVLGKTEPENNPPSTFSSKKGAKGAQQVFRVERHGTVWDILLEATYDEAIGDWFEVFNQQPEKGIRRVGVRLGLAHPFTQRFAGNDSGSLEPLMRIAAALGLAETTAREIGVKKAGTVRVHFNELLGTDALSRD